MLLCNHHVLDILFLFLTLLCVNGEIQQTHFKFYGEVFKNEGSHVIGQYSTISKSRCAASCRENDRCQAFEMCTDDPPECRLTTGETPIQAHNSSHPRCQLFYMVNNCETGHWDRVQEKCVQNNTNAIPTNNCVDCHCLLGLLSMLLGGETTYTLSSGKTLLCDLELGLLTTYKWTIIQRHQIGGSVDFDKDWNEYKHGFGSVTSDFWIGNDVIHHLTNNGNTLLQIKMIKTNGYSLNVEYSFSIDSESNNYMLQVSNFQGSFGIGDPFTPVCLECANGMKFTTKDRDNDNNGTGNCAEVSKGGWWHNSCQKSNLNGRFGESDYRLGVNWDTITNLRYVEMRVRNP
ncbi:ficolin-2-like [Saccostrea echinata]|uniref:ficolin-2-like n=1 Tax=Saccostrea echinata TaxID=191078 RepID=UPI002A7ED7B1|nr:ficolin-2-like [Saccostrea echinata]